MSASTKVVLDAGHFDSKAREWDQNPVFIERANKIAAGIRAAVPLNRSMRALDYGSGSGLLSFPLCEELGHIVLTDTSPGMLQVVQEKIAAQGIANMTPQLADLSVKALPDERFDLIYSSMVLHHIPDTDAILRAWHAHLNTGGWLCIADLDKEDGSFHGIEVDVHHGFAREELSTRVQAAGFSTPIFTTVFQVDKDQPQRTRAFPVFLLVAQRG